ncbi:MAG: arylsulfatase [Akkermansiaceae bacterium]
MKYSICLLITCSAFLLNAGATPLKGSRPNIIVVMTDDQGMGDLSCMGNEIVKTPHIDRFHEGSTRFTDFQVSPTCAPTRAALMSGRAPFKNGVTHTIYQRERMALDVFTFPQALQSAGYQTGLFGKWHLGDEEEYLPQNRGFNEVLMHGAGGLGQVNLGDFPTNNKNTYFDNVLLHNETVVKTKGYCTDLFVASALSWVKEQHSAGTPYFAYVSLNAPHGPWIAPQEYQQRFLDAGYDKKTAARYGMIENLDDNFGLMIKKLEEWDALKNTLIIFMTDNGMAAPQVRLKGEAKKRAFNANFKGGKNSPYEGGSHVPAFWQWKGKAGESKLGEGVDIPVLTAHLDLYQTFTELAGVELPEQMQELEGRSLLPLLENPNAEWADRELFFHCGRWDTGERDKAKYVDCAVRTSRWRWVNNSELYDISNDPGETKNVVSEYPEVVAQLREAYDNWWESALPMMVNEGLPKVAPSDQPFTLRYNQQLEEKGIPEWKPAKF